MFVEIGGELVRAVAHGSGDRALITLGGAPAGFERWQQPCEALSRTWLVVGLDPRGIDQSKVFPPESVTLDTMVADVVGAMDHAGLDRSVVAGEGLSGRIALAAAVAHPERIAGVVTVSTPAVGSGGLPVDRLGGDYLAAIRDHADAVLPEVDQEHLRVWSRNMWLRTDPTSAARVVSVLAEATPPLDGVACPVLVVHGAQDPVVSVGEAQAIAARLDDVEVVLLDGVGAAPLLTDPQRVAEAIDQRFG